MDYIKSLLLGNWLFVALILFIVFLIFRVNGLAGGMSYFAIIYCIIFPYILLSSLFSHFRGNNEPSSTSIETSEEKSDIKSLLMPLGIAGLAFIIIFLIGLDGRQKIFALTYALVLFLCLLFYNGVLALFKKSMGATE